MRANRGLLIVLAVALATASRPLGAQQAGHAAPETPDAPAVTFRSHVSLVSVSAVVRDRRGRLLSSLTDGDFEVFDDGRRRAIIDVRSSLDAPASVAILIDGSGSMVLGAARDAARRVSADLLSALTPGRDTAALLSFDTRLLTLSDFTPDFEQVRHGLGTVDAFGSTSLYDAVAGSAALVAERAPGRRAVVVLTDGADNASAYSPDEVSWIASRIDVPVYVFVVGGDGTMVRDDDRRTASAGSLAAIARATGGDLFVASTPALVTAAVRRVIDELRHQYVIAFEPADASGLRRLEVRTRQADLKVTTRHWYQGADQ